MSADWFCKIGEKKVGPLNGQQLKTFVSKGQLKPEHLVRRGSEGPWVPAGRIKGLFPAGAGGEPAKSAGKPLPKAAKAAALPTAAEAPAPPAAELPQEITLGGQHKEVELNVDKFNIETTPVMMSQRKSKSGLKGLKKSDQKKANVILLTVIGGGMTFVVIVLIWALATGKFSSPKPPEPQDNLAATSATTPANSGKPATSAKVATEKPKDAAAWPKSFKAAGVETATYGNVEVKVLTPVRGPAPTGIKTGDAEVLIVPINLWLKQGETKPVDFTSWSDTKLKKEVFLKDDKEEGKGNKFEFLGMVVRQGGDAKSITEKRIQVGLVFELPVKFPKTMYLVLPGAAVQAEGRVIAYEFSGSDVKPEAPAAASTAGSDKAEPKEGSK